MLFYNIYTFPKGNILSLPLAASCSWPSGLRPIGPFWDEGNQCPAMLIMDSVLDRTSISGPANAELILTQSQTPHKGALVLGPWGRVIIVDAAG